MTLRMVLHILQASKTTCVPNVLFIVNARLLPKERSTCVCDEPQKAYSWPTNDHLTVIDDHLGLTMVHHEYVINVNVGEKV